MLCVAWRKSLGRIWHLPQHTHYYLLAISISISAYPFLKNEICRRSINFVQSCIARESSLIRFTCITQCGVMYARSFSFLGQNVLSCMHRYKCSLRDMLYGTSNTIINFFFFNSVDETRVCCILRTFRWSY
jgi:hypothetical protein